MLDCIVSGTYEGNDFHRVIIRTARKTHSCCECGCDIKPKEEYEDAVGKTRGESDIWEIKTCMSCAKIRNSVMCNGFIYGELWAVIHDAICGHPNDPDFFCICPKQPRPAA